MPRSGVHVADVRGDLVFLDTNENGYFCIAHSQAAIVWEALSCQGVGSQVDESDLLTDLREAGLLTWSSVRATQPTTSRRPSPVQDHFQFAAQEPAQTLTHISSMLVAALRLSRRLLAQKPADWFAAHAASRARRRATHDLAGAIALTQIFHRLRPWIPRSGRCLGSSILLLEFLRLNACDADWVFGVRTYPFEAHCWVERDGVVLNDTAEHVRWFTPIFTA